MRSAVARDGKTTKWWVGWEWESYISHMKWNATRSSVTKLSSVSDCLENVEGEWLAQNHTPLSGEWAHHSALVESSTRQQAMHMWPKMTGGEAMSAALSMPRGPWQVVMSSREAAGGWWRTGRDKTPHPLAYVSVFLPPPPALSPYFFSIFLSSRGLLIQHYFSSTLLSMDLDSLLNILQLENNMASLK